MLRRQRESARSLEYLFSPVSLLFITGTYSMGESTTICRKVGFFNTRNQRSPFEIRVRLGPRAVESRLPRRHLAHGEDNADLTLPLCICS